MRLHPQVDRSLVGGAIVRHGDFVVDGSLRGRLERSWRVGDERRLTRTFQGSLPCPSRHPKSAISSSSASSSFQAATEARNVGTVVSVTDGICRIHGLADVRYGEMIEFPGTLFGLALNLEQD